MSRNFELTPCQRKLQIFFKTKYQFPRVDLITPPEKIINELNYCGHSNERYFFIYLFYFLAVFNVVQPLSLWVEYKILAIYMRVFEYYAYTR